MLAGPDRFQGLPLVSGLGFSGWAIVFVACAIIVFVVSILLTPKKVQRVEKPLTTVTVQVLNGCGDGGAATALAAAMLPGNGSLLYDIIEKGETKMATFERTTVVDRRGSPAGNGQLSDAAREIAQSMGIDDKDVILLKLEDNILDVDVTVIAGQDYHKYIDKLKKTKEASL